MRKHGANHSTHTSKTEQSMLSLNYRQWISIIKSKNNKLQSILRRLQSLNESKKSLRITLQDQADSLKTPEKIIKMVQHKHFSTLLGEKYSRYWVISIACIIRSKHHFSNRDCDFRMDSPIPAVQTSNWLTHRSFPQIRCKDKNMRTAVIFSS